MTGIRNTGEDAYDTLDLATCVALRLSVKCHRLAGAGSSEEFEEIVSEQADGLTVDLADPGLA